MGFQNGSKPFGQGFSSKPPDSHHGVVEQPVVEPNEKTPDDMRVSSEGESTDLPLIEEKAQRTTRKQAHWQAQCYT